MHARDWVTWHGFALNVTTDLRFFDLIVPCGIQSVRMTSLQAERSAERVSLEEVGGRVVDATGRLFDLTPRSVTRAELASAQHDSTTERVLR